MTDQALTSLHGAPPARPAPDLLWPLLAAAAFAATAALSFAAVVILGGPLARAPEAPSSVTVPLDAPAR